MFEYLMPMLVMRSFPDTVLAQTCAGALERQIAYGGERSVPWGVSESAYNVRDRHQTYQYRPFGVPDLALKRGLGRELVVAPYASVLATMIDPQRALANLARLEDKGRWAPTASAMRSTTPAPTTTGPSPSCAPTWRTTWAWASWRSPTRWPARSGRRGSTPTRWCARRSCCCTSGFRGGSCCRSRRAPGGDESMPEAEIERPAVRELDDPDTPQPARGPARPPAVHDHGEPLRRRVQPLRVARRHPLARRTARATPPASSAT